MNTKNAWFNKFEHSKQQNVFHF